MWQGSLPFCWAEKIPTRSYRYNAVKDGHQLPWTVAGTKQCDVPYVRIGSQCQARKNGAGIWQNPHPRCPSGPYISTLLNTTVNSASTVLSSSALHRLRNGSSIEDDVRCYSNAYRASWERACAYCSYRKTLMGLLHFSSVYTTRHEHSYPAQTPERQQHQSILLSQLTGYEAGARYSCLQNRGKNARDRLSEVYMVAVLTGESTKDLREVCGCSWQKQGRRLRQAFLRLWFCTCHSCRLLRASVSMPWPVPTWYENDPYIIFQW